MILNPVRFTEHVSTTTKKSWPSTMQSFTVNEEHGKLVAVTTKRAPRNMKTNGDKIFIEALWLEPEATAKIICIT